MLNTTAQYAAKYLEKKGKIESDKLDIYIYGLEIIFSSAIITVSIFLFSFILFSIQDAVIFMVMFVPIRLFCGGYHAATYGKCYLCTLSFFTVTTFLSHKIIITEFSILLLVIFICSFYIFNNSPVIQSNNPLGREEILKNHIRTLYCLIINFAITIFLFTYSPHYATLAVYTISLVTIMIYIPKKGGKHHAEYSYNYH